MLIRAFNIKLYHVLTALLLSVYSSKQRVGTWENEAPCFQLRRLKQTLAVDIGL